MRALVKVAAASVALLIVVAVSVSFGTSHTGLFHLDGDPEPVTQRVDANKWDAVGNVSVSSGEITGLGA